MRQKCYLTLATGRACGLSRISYAYLTWVAMWDRFFRQPAYIGITRSCMRWYVRKNYLTCVKQRKSRSGVYEKYIPFHGHLIISHPLIAK